MTATPAALSTIRDIDVALEELVRLSLLTSSALICVSTIGQSARRLADLLTRLE